MGVAHRSTRLGVTRRGTGLGVALALVVMLAGCLEAGPEPAAVVNDAAVPAAEFAADTRLAAVNPQLARLLDTDDSGQVRADLRARVLTQNITDAVIAQSAEELGVTITSADLDAQRQALVEGAGGQGVIDQRLASADVGAAVLDRLVASLATAAAVEDALADRIPVSDADLAAHHRANRGSATVRHIVVGSERAADRVIARLSADGRFGALARERSRDDDTRDAGGRLGTITRDEAGRQGGTFAAAVFDTRRTGVLEPIRTFQGWHVIEVLDRDPGPPLADVVDEVRAEIQQEQVGEVYSDWVGDHVDEADVTVDPAIGTWDPAARAVEAVDARGA